MNQIREEKFAEKDEIATALKRCEEEVDRLLKLYRENKVGPYDVFNESLNIIRRINREMKERYGVNIKEELGRLTIRKLGKANVLDKILWEYVNW